MARRLARRRLGGWEVYDEATHIGWVVKVDGRWRAFVIRPGWLRGRQVGWDFPVRSEAVDEVFIQRP